MQLAYASQEVELVENLSNMIEQIELMLALSPLD